MAHFGVLAYKGSGHLNPLIALSRELVRRGHRVTFFQQATLEGTIRRHGLEFVPVALPQHAPSRRKPRTRLGAIREAVQRIGAEMKSYLAAYPPALRAAGVDVILAGEISLTAPTVAELLGLPYIVISTSIPHNFGWEAAAPGAKRLSWMDRLQRAVLEVSVLHMQGPVRSELDRLRRTMGLGPVRDIARSHPPLAHISQWPRCLDHPIASLPSRFFYAGPFIESAAREPMLFPWGRLDGRPLVYASLGTTRKGDPESYGRIASACHILNLQLVLSLGGRRDPAAFAGLPGDPIVVGNAPQLDLLRMATIVVTHAGPNTAMESLLEGKPMVAMPIRLDQPAVATRLLASGVAEVLPPHRRSVEQIVAALAKILVDSRYIRAAQSMQRQLRSLHGLRRAGDIIEDVLANVPYGHATKHDDRFVTTA